ncbi:Modification methylase BanI [subsurface metagenome]
MNEIRFIDLFSGTGGVRLGLQKAGSSSEPNIQSSRNSSHVISRYRGAEKQKHSHFRCVWSCDNNKYANQVYTARFGEANHYPGDVRGVDPEEIPDFDLLCAGFPCQSFSVAGKRKGFQDTRGTLFFEISRIAEAKRPQMLLLENVKGLLSSDRGQTFETILQELGRIGYWAEWQIFNSKHHGVPQNRERVFIVGHLGKGRSRPIFPITEANGVLEDENREEQGGRTRVQGEVSPTIDARYGALRNAGEPYIIDTFNRGAKQGETYSLKTNPSPTSSAVLAILTDNLGGNIKDRIKDADKNPAWTLGGSSTKIALRPKDDWFSQHAIYPLEGIGPTIRGNQNDPAPRIAISFTNPHDSEEERKINLGDISRAVKPPYGNQQPLILADRTRSYADLGRNLESPKEITNALSGVQKDNLLLENLRIRRLTPCECERLQGFPDGWTAQGICKKGEIVWTGKYKTRVEIDEDGLEVTRYRPIMTKAKADGIYPISDTQRYKMLGNAVTTKVITFLGHRILETWK